MNADEGDAIQIGIQVAPSTISFASKSVWVTVHADISYGLVTGASVTLNGLEVVTTFADDCGDLVAKFYSGDVKGMVEPGDVELVLSGVTIYGAPFVGTDVVRVIGVPGSK